MALSPYSVFAGLPVAVWGLLGYGIMGFLALSALRGSRPHPAWPLGLLLGLFVLSVCVSAVLAYISEAIIESLCPLCLASYAINAFLLAVGVVWLKRSGLSLGAAAAADWSSLSSRPGSAAGMLIFGALILAAPYFLVKPYWKKPGWSELPVLPAGTDASGRHWIGARQPGLEIVEFSDYECPHCRGAHKEIRLFAARHDDRVRLMHRHYPLDAACNPQMSRPFHKYACRLAEAAECAGKQGRFWEMNDAIYAAQETVKVQNVDLMELAVRIGLDRPAFRRCLEEHAARDRVSADVRDAAQLGLRGTPTFEAQGKLFLGGIPDEELSRLLSGEASQ